MNTITNILPQHGTAAGTPAAIGDVLVDAGRLNAQGLARILAHQKQHKQPFGETAMALKLASKEDIDFALSKQFDYDYLSAQDTSLSPDLVAAYQPFSSVGENLRAVRTQLMLRWFNTDPSHKALAVVSPRQGEGRSFIAGNLAIVFAQQGHRTLLVDADLRATPEYGQQSLFQLDKGAGLSGILAGRAGLDAVQGVKGLPGLAILPAGALPPNPQELLGRPAFGLLLQLAAQQFDVIIIDTPAANAFSDAEIVAARTGAALIVARKNKSLIPQAASLVRRLQDGGVAVVGSVLNDD